MSTRHKFLKILIFVVSTLIAGNTWSATCDERWPSPEFYFDNGGVTPIDNEDGTFDYDITINLVVTKPPAGGGSLSFELFGERYTGSATFRAFGVERRQAQVRMFLDGQPIGQKKIVYEGEFGLILPPAPSFTTQLVGNRLTAMNTSANTNGVFILYTWDFDLQARPSIVQEFDPPEVIYPQTPGTYCVRLWAQERSGFGGQAFDPLDQNYAAYYEVAIEEDAPIAAFDTDVLGRLARFDNTSSHPALKAMSYSWDFGDGTVSTAENPQHTYEQPGNYLVRLTATDPEGDEDTAEQDVMTEYALVIEATADDQLAQDVEHLVQVDVYNYERDDIDNLTLDLGLDPSFIEQEGIARPGVLKLLGKDQSFTTYYTIVPRAAGDTTITLTGQGDLVAGGTAQAAVDLPVSVLPDVTVSISAPSVQAAGEEVTVTLTVTNNEDFSLDGIRTDSLVITPTTLLTRLSGPVGPNGQDPRVNPLSLGPGETTTITWTYRTEGTGVIDLNAVMSFNQVNGEGRFSRSAQTRFAVDTAALELRQLRMSGGPPPPGSFTLLRGQIANVGNYDVTGIDFLLAGSQPRITHLERLVSELSPDISPRIARLVPGEVREFIIPIGVQLDVGSASRYTLPVQFSGIAEVGGEDVDVITDIILRDDLDRSRYWVDILDEVRSLLVNNVISLLDEIDEFAESSMIGSIAVGSGDALLDVLQTLGDGQLQAVDLIGRTVGDGGEQLTLQGKQLVNVATEYYSTVSLDQMQRDLIGLGYDVTVGSVDVFNNWLFSIEQAYSEGNTRLVAELITEPGLALTTSVGVEAAGAQLFTNLLRNPTTRKLLSKLKRKGTVPDEDAGAAQVQRYIDDLDETWDEVPEGVPLTGREALAAGVEGDQLGWMTDTAKRTGATFFVRPRPATAAKWARIPRYNAKPLSIKAKSVNDVDYEWLGYNQADEGLVVFREPDLPTEKLSTALNNGQLRLPRDRAKILNIIDRYNAKRAEWENRDAMLTKLNSVKRHRIARRPNPADPTADLVEEVQQAGIKIIKNGRERITTVSIAPDGKLIFDFNNGPVYSDIDLLSLATPDGTNLPPSLHQKILRESGYGMDGQHHASAQTSDFGGDAVFGRNTAEQYLGEHTRDGGGGALLIIGPDATTKGFVESFDLISTAEAAALNDLGLSNYQHYGKIVKNVTFTGGAITR